MVATPVRICPKKLYPIFRQHVCQARPALLHRFARISANLTPAQHARFTMKIFDPSAYPELKELFPELTQVQFEACLLFAFGLQQREISTFRGVSYKIVRQSIAESKAKFEPQSLNALLTAFRIRLEIFALYQCWRPLTE